MAAVRFHLTPTLSDALAAAQLLAQSTDDVATLAACSRESTMALAEVQLISRLLLHRAADDSASTRQPSADAVPPPRFVHELLFNAKPVLPAKTEKTPAHPALAPRLDKLRAAQEDREYARMVGGVVRDAAAAERDAAEMSTYRSQLGVGVNLIVSMATMFTVGAYAGGTEAEPFGVRAVCCGLALMLLAMAVEVSLFLIGAIRVDNKVHKREAQAKARGVSDRNKLSAHVTSWRSAQPPGSSRASGGGTGNSQRQRSAAAMGQDPDR